MTRHSLTFGIERSNSQFYLMIKAVGKLTHEDYALMTPMLESALATVAAPKIDALIDITEFEGWDLHAAWDDLRLGLKHGGEFEKLAIVGNGRWPAAAAKVSSWFISGQAKSFSNVSDALAWLNEPRL